MTDSILTKICTKCNETFPATLEYFRKHRKTLRSNCRLCDNAYRKQYAIAHKEEIAARRLANLEKIRVKNADYRLRNAEEIHARNVAWHAAHPDANRSNGARWRAAHPEQKRANDNLRRALKANATICDFTASQWSELKAAYKNCCAYCGRKMKRLTMDHITPLSKGGSYTLANILPACQSCNSKKHTKPAPVPVQPLLLTIAPSKPKKEAA